MKYKIEGGSLPVVICKLDRGEKVLTQSGGMSWHTQDISVSTGGTGGIGKMFKRAFAGESMFQNTYEAHSDNQEIAFASSFPGDIIDVRVGEGRGLVVQKEAFLASDVTVSTDIFFQQRLGAGLFGGEGFIMLKLYGHGMAFLEVDGSVHEYTLAHGEKMIVDTGHLVAMEDTCSMNVERAGNLMSNVFGGEGLFNTTVSGPGKVYLQSMPLNRLQDLMTANIRTSNNNNNS